MHVVSGKVFQGTIKQHSAQAAEVVAVISALENADPSVNITICTDSDWVTRAFVDWMLVWKTRDMKTSDDHSVAYARYLHYAWQLAEQRSGDTYLFKVRAHRRNLAEISILNNQVDKLAKQAAKMGPESLWDKVGPTIQALTNSIPPERSDIIKLQQKDPEIQLLLKNGKSKLWTIYLST
ncbi:hypothetical protein G0U57_020006 [Chelydra serpentina]|uniref:RNase H type-1 domain-containing protein n=1 Tax=Chelydra serpentina TaxID=8475 RepID=A0A8T1S4Z4_CHESE|nr:hypothetical protein G0U57_020006 [Chelydra serpentina]